MNETNNSIQPVVDAIKANLGTIRDIRNSNEGITLTESAQIFLMDKFGYTQIQAQEVIEDLEKGVEDYIANRDAIKADGDVTVQLIEKATEAYSAEERTDIYVKVLTSIQLVANPDADIDALTAANKALTDAELVAAISGSLGALPFEAVMETVKDGITPEAVAALSDTDDMLTPDFMLATAVMLYAGQKEGTISLCAGDAEVSATAIGAMAGAGVDAMAATIELKAGKIDLSIWQKVVKYALCALFTVTFAALATLAVVAMASVLLNLIFSIFGLGIVAVLVAIPAIYYFTKDNIKGFEDLYEFIIEKLSPLYDSLIVKITNWVKSLFQKIKQAASRTIDTVKEKVGANKPKHDADNAVDVDPVLA